MANFFFGGIHVRYFTTETNKCNTFNWLFVLYTATIKTTYGLFLYDNTRLRYANSNKKSTQKRRNLLLPNIGCPKIHARFEFASICAVKCCQQKKNSLTADSLGLVKMEHYTREQRVFIVEQYFKNNESLAATVRKFSIKYGRNIDLTSSTVKRVIGKFRETGSIGDAKHTGRPKTIRSNVNIEAVRASTKFSQIYAKWSWKISTKECVCASKAVEAICLMFYSIHNPILCTLWFNKKITI